MRFIVHDTVGGVPQGVRQTALDRLGEFRCELYGCFGRWRDALFELTDALAGAGRPVGSIAELMFEPACRRGWGSLYQALQHGVLDQAAARRLLVGQIEAPRAGQVPMFAVDQSKYPRPYTRYVPDVGLQYAAEQDGYGGAPVIPGWSMQKVAYVGRLGAAGPADAQRSSWSQPVDVARVGGGENANEIAATQMRAVAQCWHERHPGTVPLLLFDVGYCPIFLSQQLPADTQILVRLRGDRVFFGASPPRQPGKVGRPVKHGPRFALDEPDTWGPPDAEHIHTAADGTTVYTRAWHDKHPEPRPRRKWAGTDIVAGTLIRREATAGDGHTRVWWLWWAGPEQAFW